MALLLPPGTRVTTAADVTISGGKVRVYNANTTTLSSLFSDTGLSVPLSNPVIANSAGYPSSDGSSPVLIFVAAGNYDVAFLDASNNVLASFEDVPSLGSDSSTLSRDFTNSRFAVRGSGGTVYVEAGDASPDTSGGTGVLGGWNGTQADSWSVNAVLTNIIGRLKENGKKILGHVSVEATTFTAVSSVDIPLANDPTGVRAWEVWIFDFIQSTDTNINVRFSTDGGGSFFSSGTEGVTSYQDTSGMVTDDYSSAGAGNLTTHSVTTPANQAGFMKLTIIGPDSGSMAISVMSHALAVDLTTGVPGHVIGAFQVVGAGGRPTHMRLLPFTGTITGKYRVVPLRGFGDV